MRSKHNSTTKNFEQNDSGFKLEARLYAQKKYTDARLWIEKAITNGGAKSGTILEHYGDILYQLNETDKAVEQWQKAKTLGDTSDKIDAKIKNKKL